MTTRGSERSDGSPLKAYDDIVKLVGVVTTVSAVVSVIQHILHVGLVPVIDDFVSYYRNLTTPVFNVLYWPLRLLIELSGWNLHLPPWVQDLHLLSFVGGGLIGRGLANERVIGGYWGGIALGFIYGFCGFGLILLFFVLVGMLIPGSVRRATVSVGPNDSPVTVLRVFKAVKSAVSAGWAAVIAVFALYAVNAGILITTP